MPAINFQTRFKSRLSTPQETGNGNPFGQVITLGAGTYTFRGPVVIPGGTTIQGAGLATTLVDTNPVQGQPSFMPGANVIGGYAGNVGVRLRDFTINGNGPVMGQNPTTQMGLIDWELSRIHSRGGYDFGDNCYLQGCYFDRLRVHYGELGGPALKFKGNLNVVDMVESMQRFPNADGAEIIIIGAGNILRQPHVEGLSKPYITLDITGTFNRIEEMWNETVEDNTDKTGHQANRDGVQIKLQDAGLTMFDHVFLHDDQRLMVRNSPGVKIDTFTACGSGVDNIADSIDIDDKSTVCIGTAMVNISKPLPPNIRVDTVCYV